MTKNKPTNSQPPFPQKQSIAAQQSQARVVVQQQTFHQGPLPPPDVLERYEALNPGFANRLLIMVENEQQHRQKIEADTNQTNIKLAQADRRQQRAGQIMAFLLGLVLISSSVFLGFYGHDVVASILGGSTLLGAIGLFLNNRKQSK